MLQHVAVVGIQVRPLANIVALHSVQCSRNVIVVGSEALLNQLAPQPVQRRRLHMIDRSPIVSFHPNFAPPRYGRAVRVTDSSCLRTACVRLDCLHDAPLAELDFAHCIDETQQSNLHFVDFGHLFDNTATPRMLGKWLERHGPEAHCVPLVFP